jgi:hypothetical protein
MAPWTKADWAMFASRQGPAVESVVVIWYGVERPAADSGFCVALTRLARSRHRRRGWPVWARDNERVGFFVSRRSRRGSRAGAYRGV